MSMKTVLVGSASTTNNTASFRIGLQALSVTPLTTITQVVMPVAGTIVSLRVKQATTPSASNSRTYTLQKNGSDTAMTLTISNPDMTGNTTSNPVTYAAGDTINLATTATAADATGDISFTLLLRTQDNISAIFTGPTASPDTTLTRYCSFQNGANWNGSTTNQIQVFPTAGTFKNFRVNLAGTPGSGKNYTYTLFKNDIATVVVIVVADLATSGSDLSNSVSAVAGDQFYWQCVPSGTPTARTVTLSCEFDPTENGESVQCHGARNTNTSTTTYHAATGSNSGTSSLSTTETLVQLMFHACKLYSFYGLTSGQAGNAASGKKYNYTVRDNAADTTLTLEISETATTGSDLTHTVDIANDDLINYKIVPTSSPSLINATLSMVSWIKPERGAGNFFALKDIL